MRRHLLALMLVSVRVYEKDPGARTGRIAAAMKTYDPDGTWKAVTS